MPFSGPQGQGPFEDHEDCRESMVDEPGIEDADALCAAWEREAKGRTATKMRFDELSRKRLLQCAADHPDLMAGAEWIESDGRQSTIERADGDMSADIFRIVASEDDDREFESDLLGVGVDFPNAGVYVDWNIDAWPEDQRLGGPHVSEYDSLEDAQQVAEGVIEPIGTLDAGDGLDETQALHRAAVAATPLDVVGGPGFRPGVQPLQKQHQVDLWDPPEELEQALEADDFVIYGRASIQQYDIEQTRISVKGLEDALDRFFDSRDAPGIISRGHTDVPVGMPVREHTLDTDTTLVIDGETYDFEAGDTLRTEVKDADDDQLPELWLVSRLANDSDIARETRLQALTGELNGYSVTVKPKEGATRTTETGRDVLAVDLHAVTVGSDEQIKNKGSEFDVAEFKALARAGEAAEAAAVFIENIPTRMGDTTKWLLQRASGGSDEEPAGDSEPNTEQKADDEDRDDEMDEAEQEADPVDAALEAGTIEAAQAGTLRDVASKMDDGAVETLIDKVADGDLDVDEAVELVEGVNGDAVEEMADTDANEVDAEQKGDDADDEADEAESKADAEEEAEVEQKQVIDEQALVERILDVLPDDVEVDPADLMSAVQSVEHEADDEKDAPGELKSALEAAEATDERLESIESKLDTLTESAVTHDELEQKLNAEDEAEQLITRAELEEQFDDLIQQADRSTTPSPTAGETDGAKTLADSVPHGGD